MILSERCLKYYNVYVTIKLYTIIVTYLSNIEHICYNNNFTIPL